MEKNNLTSTQVKSRKAEKGQSLVELAISFLILLLLLGGAIDIGTLFFRYVQVRDAAEEVNNYISLNLGTSSSALCTRAKAASSQLNINCSDIVYSITNNDACAAYSAGDTIYVTITYRYNFVMPLISTVTGKQFIDLKAKTTGTVLTPICN